MWATPRAFGKGSTATGPQIVSSALVRLSAAEAVLLRRLVDPIATETEDRSYTRWYDHANGSEYAR